MTKTMLRKFAPLALAATLGFAVPADELSFHPADGTSLTKKFTSEFTLRLEDLSVNAMGQEISPDMMGDPQVTFTGAMGVTLTDEFVKVGRGRPLELARAFDELGGTMSFEASAQGESTTDESKLESDLAGKTVKYAWDEKESKYTIAWAAGHDGDAKLLEDLEEDMDLRFVLGEGEHKEGDTWEVPASRVADMLFPGASFKLAGPDDAGDDEAMKFLEELDLDTEELLRKLFAGSVKATYVGLKDVDGQKLAEIQLEAEIQSSNDFADLLARAIDKVIEREGGDVGEKPNFEQVTLDLSFKGAGTLMWDAQAGHAHSFELNGEGTAAISIAASMDQGGQSMSMKGNVEFGGDFSSKLEVSK